MRWLYVFWAIHWIYTKRRLERIYWKHWVELKIYHELEDSGILLQIYYDDDEDI